MRILFVILLTCLLVAPAGCQKKKSSKKKSASSAKASRTPTRKRTTKSGSPRGRLNLSANPPEQTIFVPPAGSGNTIVLPEVKKILDMVKQASQDAPTTVIWLLDTTASNAPLLNNVTTQLGYFFQQAGDEQASQDLLTAIVSFAAEGHWITEQPTADKKLLSDALTQLGQDSSGHEQAFTVLGEVIDKSIQYRIEDQRQVVIVVVTDEAGDDDDRADAVLAATTRYAIPVYVIGPAAPFGRSALLADSVEVNSGAEAEDGWKPIYQGPESRHSERLQLPFAGFGMNMERVHSGFGPFSWERVCRASGGSYLAVVMPGYSANMMRDLQSGGTYLMGRLDPEQMPRYTPDYISESAYRQLLSDNAARRALHEAAKLPPVGLLDRPQTTFNVRSEAQLANDLGKAQLAAARLEPAIQKLHTTLKSGEQDRQTLSKPRWQAGYDLAMGRTLAARARVEGYNAMLALLKRGKVFENPGSTTWILVPDDTLNVGSNYERMVDRARNYLQGVIDDHKGTPWARVAARELETKLGWKWTEQ